MFVLSTAASAVGAMLPDIDHNNSALGSQRKKVVDFATKILSVLFGLVVLAFCGILIASEMYTQLIIMTLLTVLPIFVLSSFAHLPFIRNTLKFFVKHRGIMHTLAAPLLLYLGYTLILNTTVRFGLLAMAAGYISHLFLDCLTKRGCPLFWPVIPRNISLLIK